MYDACVPWPERRKGAKDKSRGPKGLELEVGARRAPKLLVAEYCSRSRSSTPHKPSEAGCQTSHLMSNKPLALHSMPIMCTCSCKYRARPKNCQRTKA